MSDAPLPALFPGYARCVRCQHIFLENMLRSAFHQLWCPWCLEQRPGTPHGVVEAAQCECRRLAR